MYKIIGGDGREYGPVTEDQLRQWIGEGRVVAQTRARRDESGEWKPLSEFSEFGDLLKSAAVPPLSPLQSIAHEVALPAPAKTSGLAIASLVLGCMGFLCWIFTAIPGIILGIVGLSKINNSGGRITGKGLAISGICVSCFTLLFSLSFILAGMMLPALGSAREKARRMQCMNNLKQISLAMKLYSADNQGRYPTDVAETTLGSYKLLVYNNTQTSSYMPSLKVWACPSDPFVASANASAPLTARNVSYAYGGFGMTENVQPDTPIMCDRSSAGDPMNTTLWRGNQWTHKSDGGNVSFADGHVAFLRTLQPPMYKGKNP